MRHRHIDIDGDILSVTAVASIIERGQHHDIVAMMRKLRADPFSKSADNALMAAENSDVYGYPTMIRECIAQWRREHGAPFGP